MPILDEQEAILALGKKIRLLRKERKLSMQTLANIAEIELSQIHRIELGKINPRFTTILKIANALSVEVKDLF